MEHAIPGFASWQLASVPRFLVTEEIERVIDSCNDYLFGIRDRPVLLLLARLGLRAIFSGSFDWEGTQPNFYRLPGKGQLAPGGLE